MEFKEVIKKRATVRKFKDEEVKLDDLKEMIRLAGLAPSVNNSQPWRFIAITNRELLNNMQSIVRKKIDEVFPEGDQNESKIKSKVTWYSTFFAEAPVVVAVATCPYEAVVDKILAKTEMEHKDINFQRGMPDIQSLGASVQNLLLAAVDMGYGGCWLSGPLVAKEGLEECLGLSKPWKLAAMVAIGVPDGSHSQKEKKRFEEIFELRA